MFAPLEALWEALFLEKAAHGPGSVAPFHLQSRQEHLSEWTLLSHHISSASESSRPPSPTRTSEITVGPLDNPDHLPISRSLAASTKSLSPGNVTYSQVPRIRTWTSLQGRYSAYRTEYENMGSEQLSSLPFYCGSILLSNPWLICQVWEAHK